MSKLRYPAKHPDAEWNIVFNFADELASGATISSITDDPIPVTAIYGTDATPAAILSGSPTLSGTSVIQKVIDGVHGVDYELTCRVTASNGEKLTLEAILPVRNLDSASFTPTVDALTSLDKLKNWCQIDQTSTAGDELLDDLLTRVSNLIVFESGRDPFFSASVSEVRNGTGGDRIMAKADPITAVSSVKVNGTTISAATSTTAYGYAFDSDMIYLRGYTFTEGVQNIELSYTAGFATNSHEARIAEQAALVIGSAWYRRISHMDVVTESKGMAKDIVRTFSQKDIPAEAKMMISKLKRVSMVF